jgi:hypothetical protein
MALTKSDGLRASLKVSQSAHGRGDNADQNARRNHDGVMRHVGARMQHPHASVMHCHDPAPHGNWRGGEGEIGAWPEAYHLEGDTDNEYTDEEPMSMATTLPIAPHPRRVTRRPRHQERGEP